MQRGHRDTGTASKHRRDDDTWWPVHCADGAPVFIVVDGTAATYVMTNDKTGVSTWNSGNACGV